MATKEKNGNFEQYWEEQRKRDLFTWVHRYLRLHEELLEDSVYEDIYNYSRQTLITFLKEDISTEETDDEQLG